MELLGLILGGVFRLLPELLGLFKAKRDADHEHRMTLLQLDIDKARAAQALDMVAAQAAVAQQAGDMAAMVEALRGEGNRHASGIPLLDWLSSSVRPVLTYWWCLILYTIAKGFTIVVAIKAGAPLDAFAGVVVTEFDRMVIGSIFTFWFVDRSLRRGAAK